MTRLLLLPTPFRYSNPSWEFLIRELYQNGHGIIIGPMTGRPSNDLEHVIKTDGPFDAVIIDPWFFFQSPSVPDEYRPRKVSDLGIPVIVSLMRYDLHNLPVKFVETIKENSAAAICTASGNEFFIKYTDDHFKKEEWLQPPSDAIASSELFNEKFILIPHCIAPNEIITPTTHRKSDLIIPGVAYHFRKAILRWAEDHSHLQIRNEKDFLQKILGRLSTMTLLGNRISILNRPIGLELYRRRFRKSISESLVAVTCDGSINYPIRKYFEIPAFGTILAARFFDRPERLGFRHRDNCFQLDENNLDELLEIVELARSDSIEAHQVRDAGQTMVRELHSVSVRATQLLALCNALSSGIANTMIWENGHPILQRQDVAN